MKLIFFSFFLMSSVIVFGQNKTLYIIDSIPYNNKMPFVRKALLEDFNLKDNEIASIKTINSCIEIEQLGLNGIDTVHIIFTKAYCNRPKEYKNIPNILLFQLNRGLIYYQDTTLPYSGSFIEYYINGFVKSVGEIRNGLIDGKVYEFDRFGEIIHEFLYKGGYQISLLYSWPNGNIRQEINWDSSTYNIVYYSPDGSQINYTKEQMKSFKKITTLIGEDNFKKKENYKSFKKEYKYYYSLYPQSFHTYSLMGSKLFFYGEIEAAISMLDSAIKIEPLDIYSRMCRLYSLIYKYERDNAKTINEYKGLYIPTETDSLTSKIDDFEKICLDINFIKNQGFRYISEHTFENEWGDLFFFRVNIIDAEKRYCK